MGYSQNMFYEKTNTQCLMKNVSNTRLSASKGEATWGPVRSLGLFGTLLDSFGRKWHPIVNNVDLICLSIACILPLDFAKHHQITVTISSDRALSWHDRFLLLPRYGSSAVGKLRLNKLATWPALLACTTLLQTRAKQ